MSIAVEEMGKYVSGLRPGANGNWIGFCPLHGEVQGKSTPSFSFREDTGAWHCFANCGGGGFAYFLKLLGKSRPFIDKTMEKLRPHLASVPKKSPAALRTGLFQTPYPLPERILGLFDRCPENLLEAGFSEDVLFDHDVGYDETRERITWPIRDIQGTLAGISGRGFKPGERYKIYDAELREMGFANYSFEKSAYLWRWEKVYSSVFFGDEKQTVYLTEGFKACLWLVQHGYPNTVALMTSSMSDVQASFFEKLGANIVLCLDGDWPGLKGAAKIGYRLPGCDIRVVSYPPQVHQPDDLSPQQLHDLIGKASAFHNWRRNHESEIGKIPRQRSR
jgi:DNA primase